MIHVRILSLLTLLPLTLCVEWVFDEFKNPDGTPFTTINGPTVIEQGPDLRYYVGSKGWVYALTVDKNYTVQEICKSESIGADRTVLGLTFEPRKFEMEDVYLYISTSTLNWGGGREGDPLAVPGGWKNGKIQIMRSGKGGHCLGVIKDLVSGLSVSNHDHGVNGMVVGEKGTLYVMNGGMTNAGHSEIGDGDGGSPATPLSGALLEIDYNKVGFDGGVVYDSDDGRIANVTKGDINIYAVGFMNALPVVLHMNGGLYTVDNGPNEGYGKESISCNEHIDLEPHYQDKFIRIRRKGWYGHPNRNRGRYDSRQCKFRALGSGGDGVAREIMEVESSTNGLIEYTSAKMGRDYKGCMIFARIGFVDRGNMYMLCMDETGERVLRREEIGPQGGLGLTMDRFGNLVTTDYVIRRIKVIRPAEEVNKSVVVWSILPRRGAPEGGNFVWISGRFGNLEGVSVLIGSRICGDVTVTDDLIRCRVPSGQASDCVSVSVGVGGVWSDVVGKDYCYLSRRTNGGLLPHML